MARPALAAAMRSRSKTTPVAPVQLISTSVAASSTSMASQRTALTPNVATSAYARWNVRLATMMRLGADAAVDEGADREAGHRAGAGDQEPGVLGVDDVAGGVERRR